MVKYELHLSHQLNNLINLSVLIVIRDNFMKRDGFEVVSGRPRVKLGIENLVTEGRYAEAIQELEKKCALDKDKLSMRLLRDLRMKAFDDVERNHDELCDAQCPPEVVDPFPRLKNKIPEINADKLDLAYLAGGIRHHGALIVRNIMSKDMARELTDDINHVIDAMEDHFAGKKTREQDSECWFAPIYNERFKTHIINAKIMQQTGSAWTLFSPLVTQKIISIFEQLQLKILLKQYFCSEPCLSFNKWVLRRVDPLTRLADWHQDGRFMGANIKSINLWMSLTECGAGTSSPGMDLIPTRLDRILEAGTNNACFDWSISHDSVAEWFADCPPERPYFNAGDAIFFDHLNLHVTSHSENYTNRRYAIETWFFALSQYAENQAPVMW